MNGYVEIEVPYVGVADINYKVLVKELKDAPRVILMHEIYGLNKECIEFADRLHNDGFSVYLPLFFGELGETDTRRGLKFCLSKEFMKFSGENGESQTISWLRGLCRHLKSDADGKIGVIGMCMSGGFALAMAVEDGVAAPVMGHPTRAFRRGGANTNPKIIGISERTVDYACNEIIRQDKKIMGFRLPFDQFSPNRIMDRLDDRLGDRLEVFQPKAFECFRNGPNPFKHSLLTSSYPSKPETKPNNAAVKAYGKLKHFLTNNLQA